MIPDTHYFKFLCELDSVGSVVLNTEELPAGAMLKDFYTDEGVIQSLAFKLYMDAKEFTYCTVASYEAKFKPSEIVRITAIIHQVRGLMGSSSEHPAITN